MRLILAFFLLCLAFQPHAFGGPYSGGSFGGRAGFRAASPSFSAPRYSAPRYTAPSMPRYTAPAASSAYRPSSSWPRTPAAFPTHTVIIEHHHYDSTPWIVWDRGDYVPPPRGYGSGAGCSCASKPAPTQDAGSDRPAQLDAGGMHGG